MKNEKMYVALNKQINAEFYSAYLYFSMAAFFEAQNLKGFANWMIIQAQEEINHGMKFYKFLNERRWQVELTKIDAPEVNWESSLAVFKASFVHEQKVTSLINNLVALAGETKDYPSSSFLQWFIDEQVEEEAAVDAIVQKLSMIGDDYSALLMLDTELGKRTLDNE